MGDFYLVKKLFLGGGGGLYAGFNITEFYLRTFTGFIEYSVTNRNNPSYIVILVSFVTFQDISVRNLWTNIIFCEAISAMSCFVITTKYH